MKKVKTVDFPYEKINGFSLELTQSGKNIYAIVKGENEDRYFTLVNKGEFFIVYKKHGNNFIFYRVADFDWVDSLGTIALSEKETFVITKISITNEVIEIKK